MKKTAVKKVNETPKKRWPKKVTPEPQSMDVAEPSRPLVTFRVIGRR